ncbi:helix-turn-helix transcriptional regulator [Chitinophaga sp. MM2321]|uniref:helix-turn-helix transcriptional regulator n=1 Tax=Chitinophaga sp. MM2321 TaxID=3137178 RepID=UPI0032D5793A
MNKTGTTKETVRCNIQLLRKSQNLSQGKFAKLLKVSRSALGSYKEGRCTPSIETLLIVSKTFNIQLEILITKNLSVVWKENAQNATKQKNSQSSSKTQAILEAANAIVENAQMLLQEREQKN